MGSGHRLPFGFKLCIAAGVYKASRGKKKDFRKSFQDTTKTGQRKGSNRSTHHHGEIGVPSLSLASYSLYTRPPNNEEGVNGQGEFHSGVTPDSFVDVTEGRKRETTLGYLFITVIRFYISAWGKGQRGNCRSRLKRGSLSQRGGHSTCYYYHYHYFREFLINTFPFSSWVHVTHS